MFRRIIPATKRILQQATEQANNHKREKTNQTNNQEKPNQANNGRQENTNQGKIPYNI